MKTTTKTKQSNKKAAPIEIRTGRPVGSIKKDVPLPHFIKNPRIPKPESWTDTLEKKSKKTNIFDYTTEEPKPLNYIKWDYEKSNDETIKKNNQVEKSNDINVKIDFSDLKESLVLILKAFLFVNVVLAIIIISFMIKYIF